MVADPQIEAILRRPGISEATLRENGVRYARAAEAQRSVGLAEPGLLIPYRNRFGQPILDGGKEFFRLRLDHPDGGRKYHSPKDSSQHPFFPAGTMARIVEGEEVVLVEGEFKAMSLAEFGLAAVGLSGFYATSKAKNGGHELLSELEQFIRDLGIRKILFLGDSDTALNWQFADAAAKLNRQVQAKVLLPRIPLKQPKGIDDCREAMGSKFENFWTTICHEAIEMKAKMNRDDLALLLLSRTSEALDRLQDQERFHVLRKIIDLASLCQSRFVRSEIGKFLKKHAGVPLTVYREEVGRIEDQRLESKGEGTTAPVGDVELVEKWGAPLHGKNSLRINQPYFAAAYQKKHSILYSPEEAQFFEYTPSRGLWIPVTGNSVKTEFSRILLEAAQDFDEEGLIPMRTDVLHTALKNQLKGQSEKRDAFKSRAQFIHLANGMLDLGSNPPKLREFKPRYYSRNQSPMVFDPDALCPRFREEFLSVALGEDDIDLLQRYCGSLLLPGNLAQRILLLPGTPKGGKSTLVAIIEAVVGSNNVAEIRTEHLSERFELFRFVRKTLLTGKDVPAGFLNQKGASVLKKLTGGDLVDAEGKHLNQRIQMPGDFSIIVTSNSRLQVHLEGDSGAWSRRLMIINFEKPPPARRIRGFSKVLLDEEGSGILTWFIEGAIKHLSELETLGDFSETLEQRSRVESLLAESDSVRAFVRERVIKDESENVTTEELVVAYSSYCDDLGWQSQAKSSIERALPELMLEIHRANRRNDIDRHGNSRRGYRGLTIQEPDSGRN